MIDIIFLLYHFLGSERSPPYLDQAKTNGACASDGQQHHQNGDDSHQYLKQENALLFDVQRDRHLPFVPVKQLNTNNKILRLSIGLLFQFVESTHKLKAAWFQIYNSIRLTHTAGS